MIVAAFAQGSTAACFLGLPAISPQLREYFRLDLAGVGVLLGAMNLGIMCTLVAWGAAADRRGERMIMTLGLAGSAVCLLLAALAPDATGAGVALLGAGALGASANAASGKAVLQWFRSGRGLVMGVRQTATPLGAALAALMLPMLAVNGRPPGAFVGLAVLSATAAGATALWIREPPGMVRPGHRNREVGTLRQVLLDRRLLRLCLAGGLLVVPQFTGTTLMVALLHDHRGLGLTAASALLAVTQVLGGAGRLGAGAWSDTVGSRLRPLRFVALLTAVGFVASALLDFAPVAVLTLALVPAAALAISWNGLAFTAAGEMAPPGRSGTALGMQNTANYLSAAVTPAAAGWVASKVSWSAALLMAAGCAALALLVLRGLHEARSTQEIT